MDEMGIDADGYIAAVRAGAVDPFGATAAELDESLIAFEQEQSALMASLSDAEIDELVRTGRSLPSRPPLDDDAATRRLQLDREFAARMRALERQSARIAGEQRALMAEHLQRVLEQPGDSGVGVRELASIAAVDIGVSHRGLEKQMTDAWSLVRELPAAHESAKAGRITVGHLRVIEAETRAVRLDQRVTPEDRAAVEAELVAIAETTTPGRLRRRAKRIVDAALTEPLQQRHDAARDRRRVELFDAGDGMCDVVARVPAVLAVGLYDRLTQAARAKPKDDPRTFDQFRADALCELLLGGSVPEDLHGTSLFKAHVAITMPATELLHDGETSQLRFPAALDGRVLIDGETARRLAGGVAMWERLFTDPVTGVAVTVDTYRPAAEQQRWLHARDGGCRFPGCACGGRRADLDHTLDWAKGGTTSLDNLAVLCRGDHTLKHASRWSMRQLDHGVIEWTTPLGDVVSTVPEPIGPTFADIERALPPDRWGAALPPPEPPPDLPY
ncbi:HNH endonuclease signature motif containing protein [Agrococcus beijingensis]|uniref:HNH endonuclease signature motif containing protein n=1 Tax=Agrococcus beijingensis TaxID=3068634 RepID=UPI002742121E|nr:HNH endonuclease signature motif containing protein [Agrococcus sp. REN33]